MINLLAFSQILYYRMHQTPWMEVNGDIPGKKDTTREKQGISENNASNKG